MEKVRIKKCINTNRVTSKGDSVIEIDLDDGRIGSAFDTLFLGLPTNQEVEIEVKQFAYNLAHSDDIRQGDFLNKFAYELKVCCKDKDLSGLQPSCISDRLDSNGIDLIKSLAEFIKLREDNKPTPK